MSDLLGNRRPVFSQRGSFRNFTADFIFPYVLQFVKQLLKSMIEDVFIQFHTIVHSVWHNYVQPKYNRPVSAVDLDLRRIKSQVSL